MVCSMLSTKTQFISKGGYTTNAVKEKENNFFKKNTYTVVWKAQQKEILKKQKQPPQKNPQTKQTNKQKTTTREAVRQADVNTVAWKA